MKKMQLLTFALTLLTIVGIAQTKTVTLDYYFNHEFKKNKDGKFTAERFHYTWEDKDQSGYSGWGEVFKKDGFALKSLETAPTEESLKGTSVYLIVDPDNEKETPTPNYVLPEHIKTLKKWVKEGSRVMTDDAPLYRGLDIYGYPHESVDHSAYEYVRGDAHTNTIESFWAMLKRGINGTYIHVSKKGDYPVLDFLAQP